MKDSLNLKACENCGSCMNYIKDNGVCSYHDLLTESDLTCDNFVWCLDFEQIKDFRKRIKKLESVEVLKKRVEELERMVNKLSTYYNNLNNEVIEIKRGIRYDKGRIYWT